MQLLIGHIVDVAIAIGHALDIRIVREHPYAILRALDIKLRAPEAGFPCPCQRRDRVFRRNGRKAAVRDVTRLIRFADYSGLVAAERWPGLHLGIG